MTTRKFKRVNLLGLDFYVDWIEETGEFIAIKEVHSGRRFMYNGLVNSDGVSLEDMFRKACGIPIPEKPIIEEIKIGTEEKIEEVAPAALETEQPKEESDEKPKKRNKRSKE